MNRFKVKPTDRGLGVTCPRTDCGGRFIVNGERWRAEFRPGNVHINTRPCPYCFRVSLLPEESDRP